MKKYLEFIKQNLYETFSNPVWYLCCIVLNFFCFFNFFVVRGFFTGSVENTDYTFLFVLIPYIGSLIFPSLSHKKLYNFKALYPFEDSVRLLLVFVCLNLEFLLIISPLTLVSLCVNLFTDASFLSFYLAFFYIMLYGMVAFSLCLLCMHLFKSLVLSFSLSLISLLLTSVIHTFTRYNMEGGLVNALIKALSFSWHFDSASRGLFDTRDIFYFLLTSFSLLYITYLVGEFKKGRVYSKKERNDLLLTFLCILVGFLDSAVFYGRLDLSENKNYSLSKYTKTLLESDKEINITYYRSSSLHALYPQVSQIEDYLRLFNRNNVTVNFKDPHKEKITSHLEDYGITSRQIESGSLNRKEYMDVYSCIVFESGEKWEAIPFILSTSSLEYDIDIRLTSLITDYKRYVNLVVANGRSLEKDYAYLIPYLNLNGFICNVLGQEDIKMDLEEASPYGKLLMVLGSDFTDREAEAIETYIEKGNKALFLLSRFNTDDEGWKIEYKQNEKLYRFLNSWGVEMEKALVADISCERITMESQENNSLYSKDLNYPYWVRLPPQNTALSGLTLFWPCPLSGGSPVCTTSSYSYKVLPEDKVLFETNPFILENMNLGKDKEKGPLCVGSHYEGEVQGYYNTGLYNVDFEVISDENFVSSLYLAYSSSSYGNFRNLDFVTNRLLGLNGEEALRNIHLKVNNNPKGFYKITDNEDFVSARNRTLVSLFILFPLFVIALSIVCYCKRNKYRKNIIKKIK